MPEEVQKETEDEEEEDEDSEASVSSEEEEEEEEGTAPRSHHGKVKCRVPGCNAVVGDIKRHLYTHAKKSQLEEEDVLKAAAIMKAGKRQRGPRLTAKKSKGGRPGRFKKWCPFSDCFFISPQINIHLRSAHKLKPATALYENMLKAARRYTGLKELDVLLRTSPASKSPSKPTTLSAPLQAATTPVSGATHSSSAPFPGTSAVSATSSVPLPASAPVPVPASPSSSNPVSTTPASTSAPSLSPAPLPVPALHSSSNPVSPTPASTSAPSSASAPVPVPASSSSSEEDEDYSDESSDSSSEGEDGQTVKPKKAEYYSATTFESNRHQWLCGFFKYLHLPDAGYKKLANRLQHVGQMRNILEAIEPHGQDITVLAEDSGDAVWVRWVHPHLENKTKAPGTIISYLTSLEKFFKFVTSKKYDRKAIPPLHGNYEDMFRETIPALRGWRSTVDNETQDVQHGGHLRECDTMLTPKDITKLKESSPYAAGMKALMKAKEGTSLSLQEFADARDLIIVKLAMLVGSRPAPLENATIEDYETAKESGGNKIMLVAKHKRSKAGPASLGMDRELQQLMDIYMKKVRTQVAQEGVEKLFVKVDGCAFKRNTIGRRFRSFWEKSGVRTDKSITQTAVRKFVTTKTKKHAPEEASRIKKVLSHSEKSSRNCYLRQDLTEEASLAIDVIKRVTSAESTQKDKMEEED